MNNNFTITDNTNNIQKKATKIVKFNMEEKDYLIYCIDENEENRQIFVSRLILNSVGEYFIDDIRPEEKAKLSDIVYNIIILTPTNYKKGLDANTLLNNLTEKYKITLSCDMPELGNQTYYRESSIAITSKELVNLAIEFFGSNLKIDTNNIGQVEQTVSIPTWNIPSNGMNEVPNQEGINKQNVVSPEVTPTNPNAALNIINNGQPANVMPSGSVEAPSLETIPNIKIESESVVAQMPNVPVEPVTAVQNNIPNPQAEKIAVVSDPSLSNVTGVNVQPNMVKLNNKGKANVKYIIIGTVCILLAIAVVIIAYILIQKKTTGV